MARRRFGEDILKTIKVRGRSIEIRVSTDGEFFASAGTDHVRSDRLADLVAKVRRAIQKTKVSVAVPATAMDLQKMTHGVTRIHEKYVGQTCRRIVVTGIDPRDNDLVWRWENGEKPDKYHDDVRLNHRMEFGKPMTDAQIAEFERLSKAKRVADDAHYKFSEQFRWRELFGAVKEAIDAAVDAPKEEPEADGDQR